MILDAYAAAKRSPNFTESAMSTSYSRGGFFQLGITRARRAVALPRDLFPFFRQNLPEGYLLGAIRGKFDALLDGTDLSLLAVIGGAGVRRVVVTPEGIMPGVEMDPLGIDHWSL
jgi:serine/threonine-protein kinase HipA